jgi:sugar/nucleoside kinase (ribokinase family)
VVLALDRLLLAGEAIVDLVMRVPGLPPRGGDLVATGSSVHVGGGFNVMAAAARQGMPVAYAGGHGTGPWGDLVRAALAAEGIEVLRPPDPGLDTGFDMVLVEPDGERTFVTSLGAETHPGGWDAIGVSPGEAVYVSGYGLVPAPGTGAARPLAGPPDGGLGRWAAGLPAGVLVFADPGPLVADIPAATLDAVLARCDWWSCNRREAALLTGADDPEAAALQLLGRTRTADGGVLVRLGGNGCLLATAAGLTLIPAPSVDVVDTTGAGDAHAGVFLAGLAAGLDPPAAAGRANAAAALAVAAAGPATAPSRSELDAFLGAGLRRPGGDHLLGDDLLGGDLDGHHVIAGHERDVRGKRDRAGRGDADHRAGAWLERPRRRADRDVAAAGADPRRPGHRSAVAEDRDAPGHGRAVDRGE